MLVRVGTLGLALCSLATGCSSSSGGAGNGSGGTPAGGASATGGNATGGAGGSVAGNTGKGGASSGGSGGRSSGGQGGSCRAEGVGCGDTLQGCCAGTVCISDQTTGLVLCTPYCETNSECASNCCTPVQSLGRSACAAAQICNPNCGFQGEACTGSDCCAGSVCVDTQATGIACAPLCKNNAECWSGCCTPLDGTTERVCLGPINCL